ncbi:PRC-barrel domain-containing protein [Tropicibacter oceani]|uniref:PRC-barrel domain-containing protein n=1 Tax=Tropicibacter oceani TaxID=3058420 RepID=A0ABY8QGP0_9RHOB|nr:PRC-barrel domain-containing protein [Tropicibacter oceani]WGW03156.1 PRC-barrel domain-containing protein [Tropicibacter oceani]
MKRTTALATLILVPGLAFAESHAATGDMAAETTVITEQSDMAHSDAGMDMAADNLIRTRDITGGAVYTITDSADLVWDGDLVYDSIQDGWDKVGEIEDIVLSSDGTFKGVVAEVGGFLDIGDKHVLLTIDKVKLVPVDDASYAIVVPYTLEQLKGMENIDEGFWN